ncbi:MAG: putative O-glycosylation ligase, exosortase A system-associated [Burkholderiales bacterium]
MRDLTILLLLMALGWLAFIKPWLGVLGLVIIGLLHPQGYGQAFMQTFPAYLAMFVAVTLSATWHYARRREWPRVGWDWRIAVFAMLWAWFVVTTFMSINHWLAWPKLREVAKLLPPLLLVLALVDTREKLHAMVITMALCLAAIVVKGGYWAFITGFHDRVYGPPGSQYGDNNEFAVAVCMGIPLLALWYRSARTSMLRVLVASLIVLAFAAALSSWSRGGLLSLGAVTFLLLWHSKHKMIAIPLIAVAATLAFFALPEQWIERMASIGSYQGDGSALSRLSVWQVGIDFVREHPLAGGGFEGWVFITSGEGQFMDWHSAYVEMAAEHGLVGLALWGSLIFGTMASLTWLIRLGRMRGDVWLADHSAMLRASLVAYAVGCAFLGIAYWELLYLVIISAMLVSRFVQHGISADTVSDRSLKMHVEMAG